MTTAGGMDTTCAGNATDGEKSLSNPRHPAKFSPQVISIFSTWLSHLSPILDPFAGVGSWKNPSLIGNEIEYEWASQSPNPTVLGDATQLAFRSGSFPGACTSPTFGNRMADHHNATDDSRRNTYTHSIGHPLHSNNSGKMGWGPAYWSLHRLAWREVYRVLTHNGLFAIHVSDFIASSVRIPVCNWHWAELKGVGFDFVTGYSFPKKGLREGANHDVRVGREMCMLWRKSGL